MNKLTTVEAAVLEKILDGNDPTLASLRQQVKQAQISSRKLTGAGFFTDFQIPPDIERIPGRPSFKLSDVRGTAENVKHGVGFVLFVVDGALKVLEGFTYDEPWPSELVSLELAYSSGAVRDLTRIKGICKNPPSQ